MERTPDNIITLIQFGIGTLNKILLGIKKKRGMKLLPAHRPAAKGFCNLDRNC